MKLIAILPSNSYEIFKELKFFKLLDILKQINQNDNLQIGPSKFISNNETKSTSNNEIQSIFDNEDNLLFDNENNLSSDNEFNSFNNDEFFFSHD
ncbi:5507_t:CDS:2 [Funneliformis mosseae]|uniref:5507_t:CDS:1 n=1 Tax=Funneliformis mosseae TaxID=27381 RepID=A0A9N9BKP8_FUNMO|nr:5507_t:CDS:2 [Funneliformis mosseae]